MSSSLNSSRLLALDYLRGFCIVIIIIDHLWRWPSLLAVLTGQGKLWVTAAEGFVIISGLLIGYVRGYKNRQLSLLTVSKKLWSRALLLYIWLVGMTLLYTSLLWYVPTLGNTPFMPIHTGDWQHLILATLGMSYTHTWVYFLYIYTLLLAVTPVVIYLLRRNNFIGVAIFTTIGYTAGRVLNIEWLQWMPMFYIPAIVGYYLVPIQTWWAHRSHAQRQTLAGLLFTATFLSIALSVVLTFVIPNSSIAQTLNQAITKEIVFPAARIPIALLWVAGLTLAFHYGRHAIGKYFGWLLQLFGTRSLTTYILHGSVLFVVALTLKEYDNIWYNSAIGLIAIGITWLIVRWPLVQKIVPQ